MYDVILIYLFRIALRNRNKFIFIRTFREFDFFSYLHSLYFTQSLLSLKAGKWCNKRFNNFLHKCMYNLFL